MEKIPNRPYLKTEHLVPKGALYEKTWRNLAHDTDNSFRSWRALVKCAWWPEDGNSMRKKDMGIILLSFRAS